jgi:hypothetical protein
MGTEPTSLFCRGPTAALNAPAFLVKNQYVAPSILSVGTKLTPLLWTVKLKATLLQTVRAAAAMFHILLIRRVAGQYHGNKGDATTAPDREN